MQLIAKNLDHTNIISSYRSGAAVSDLAQQYNVGIHIIYAVLKKYKIERIKGRFKKSYIPPNKTNIKDEDIIKLHSEKHSFSEIARILGCTRPVVTGRAYKLGLKSAGFSFPVATNLESQIGTKAFSLLSDEIWLRDQYIAQNKPTRQIASEIGCGKKAITTALHRYNIPVQTGINKNKEAQIRRGFLQNVPSNAVGKLDDYSWMYEHYIVKNLSKLQIAGLCGVSQHCIHCWTKKHKLLKSKESKLAAVRAGFFAKYGCEIGSKEICWKWMQNITDEELEVMHRKAMAGIAKHRQWIDTQKAGKVFCHSSWERMVALKLDSLDAVVSFDKEGVKIDYIYLGKRRMYFPDFVVRTSLKTVVIEVKPDKLQQHPQNIVKIDALKVFCNKLGWDYLVVGGGRKGVDLSIIEEYFG